MMPGNLDAAQYGADGKVLRPTVYLKDEEREGNHAFSFRKRLFYCEGAVEDARRGNTGGCETGGKHEKIIYIGIGYRRTSG